jgi:beta-N-acetylhexosaminidase
VTSEFERLAAASLFPGFEGTEAPAWIRRWVADGLGGVVLYARNVESREQLKALTSALLAERADLLVAMDEEGGDVTRLEAATGSSYPGSAALGAVDDAELTEQVAAAIAWDLVDVGANMNLAPVADVNTNPANPVIGVRSFGSDSELVARHVAASVRGLQSAGIVACAKHFPGHGDTDLDSHLRLPSVEALSEAALLPFRAAIEAGVLSIMSAHIRVEALGDEAATTNRRVLHELLREQLGFAGMVMTDALEMRAISATMGVGEGAVRALAAGADALCLGHDLDESACRRIAREIAGAVRSGRLDGGRLAQAAERVRLNGAWASHPPRGDRVGSEVGLDAARRAIRCQGNPLLTRPPLVVELAPEPSIAAGSLREGPADWFRRALPEAEVVQLVGWPASFPIDDRGRQRVILVRDAHRHSWERAAVDALLAGADDAILIETGLPLWRPDVPRAYVATYGAGRVNVEAAIERLYSGARRGVEQSGSSPGS